MADINNTGPRYGGACNAAAFLRHFVPADGPEYAHLDIAGVMDTATDLISGVMIFMSTGCTMLQGFWGATHTLSLSVRGYFHDFIFGS